MELDLLVGTVVLSKPPSEPSATVFFSFIDYPALSITTPIASSKSFPLDQLTAQERLIESHLTRESLAHFVMTFVAWQRLLPRFVSLHRTSLTAPAASQSDCRVGQVQFWISIDTIVYRACSFVQESSRSLSFDGNQDSASAHEQTRSYSWKHRDCGHFTCLLQEILG
jgi:hypothetical protein